MNVRLLNLEICSVELHEGLRSKNLDRKKLALYNAIRILSNDVRAKGVEETKAIFKKHNQTPIDIAIESLNECCADWNIEGYITAIEKEFSKIDYYKDNYTLAEKTLFLGTVNEKGFAKSDILYEKANKKLSVAGFLSVCGYAVKIGEAINPNDTLYDEAGAAVSVFKGLELVLNNKGESNTIPKMLHLANDFLLRAVKPSLAKKEHKQVAVGLSLLVELAIDFFSAK